MNTAIQENQHHAPPATLAAPLTTTQAKQCIPADQIGRFYREETEAGRKFVLDWIGILEPLRTIKGRERMWAIIGRRTGEKPGIVKKRFYQYTHGLQGKCDPMWEELIDRSRFPRNGDRGLDARFLDHWKRIREQQKRLNDGGRQAHRDLLSDLSRWEADPTNSALRIPGYSQPPARESWCETGQAYVPRGWSYRNLMNHQPARVSLVNVIVGPKMASQLLPSNLATREGLKYREIIFTDDQDYDNQTVSFYNGGEPMRPQGFNTLEYLTGNFETYGIQLRRRDEDTGTRRGIDQEAYVWTVLVDLMTIGFRDDERGTRIIREHATAKGYAHKDGYGNSFDEELFHRTGGRVVMDASGRFDAGMFAQMFFRGKGRGKQSAGNFRYKAPLESAFRRVRTQSAGLLGDVGNRYQVAPEHNDQIDGYTRRVFKELKKLPAKDRELMFNLLRFPVHTWDEFSYLMGLVYRAINTRRDHKLEGWGACGHIIPGFALSDPTQPWEPPRIISREDFARMDADQQNYIQAFGKHHNLVLAPCEAAQLHRRNDRALVRLGREVAVSMLPAQWAYPRRRGKDTGGVKVRPDGTLVIRDPQRFGADSLIYLGTRHTPDGDRVPLNPGREYLVHVNPFHPEEALLLTLEGRYCGYLKLMPKPCANDIAARLHNQGMIEQYRADVTRDGERRAGVEIAQRTADIDHNDRVLSGEIRPTDEDRAQAHHDHDLAAHHDAADRGIITIEPDQPTTGETTTQDSDPDDSQVFRRLFANNPEID